MSRKHTKTRRGNGNGTLERRPNGRFVARWTVNGKRYSRSTGTAIRTEAEKILKECVKPFQERSDIERYANIAAKIGAIETKMANDEQKKPALKMDRALDAYFASPKVDKMSDGAVKCYSDMFKRLNRFIKGYRKLKIVEMRQFTSKMANEFLSELKKTTKTATYNHYLDFLRRFWRILAKEAKITENPWEEFPKHKGSPDSRMNLTVDEVRRVVATAEGEMRTLIMLGYYTSLRLGDCCRIRAENIKLDEGIISIVPQKTNRGSPDPVIIPIHKDLAAELEGRMPEFPKSFVLPECASVYARGSMNYRIKRLFEECGIETGKMGELGRKVCLRSFHSLRSGFVTMAAEAKTPFPVISSISGHSSLKMCHKYYRTSRENLVQCVNSIPSLNDKNATAKTSVLVDSDAWETLNSARSGGETVEDCIRRLVRSTVESAKAFLASKLAVSDMKLIPYRVEYAKAS